MRILFLGDVIGKPGRDVCAAELPRLRDVLRPDLVIVNAENAAGGAASPATSPAEMFALGADVLTSGNHWLDQKEILSFIGEEDRILRPLNCPKGTPGRGANLYQTRGGQRVLVLNPMGRTFMDAMDDPFACVEAELISCPLREGADAIIVDMHAEATSEKMAMGHFCDGRASAVVGSHSHVPTADCQVLPHGTAYQTNAGRLLPIMNSVIGMDQFEALYSASPKKMPSGRMTPATGPATLCGIFIETDDKTGPWPFASRRCARADGSSQTLPAA